MPQEPDINNNQQQPSDATPPKPAPDDLSGLKNKRDELLGEVKEWKTKHSDLDRQLKTVTEILGDISPDSLEKLKRSEEDYKRSKSESDRLLSEERAKLANQYEPQIKDLSSKLEQQQKLLEQKLQSDALRSLHGANQGKEFPLFCAMLNTLFNVEYEQSGMEGQIPQYKTAKINNKDGTPIFIDGKPATPEDIIMKIRQGEYGQAIASCFPDWNQTNGGILPHQTTNGNGKTVKTYPRAQKALMLADPKLNQEIREGMANGTIRFINS